MEIDEELKKKCKGFVPGETIVLYGKKVNELKTWMYLYYGYRL